MGWLGFLGCSESIYCISQLDPLAGEAAGIFYVARRWKAVARSASRRIVGAAGYNSLQRSEAVVSLSQV